MSRQQKTFRRPKEDPRTDAVHTLRVGMVVFICLLFFLPLIFEALG